MQNLTLRRVADVIDAGVQSPPLPGRLPAPVLQALAALVPAEAVAFADLEPETSTTYVDDEVAGGQTCYSSGPACEPDDPFWRHYLSSRYCSYPTRSGDDRTVTMRSDFYSTREWMQTPMYRDVMRPADVTYELMCPLPSLRGRSRRVMFFRSGSCDFTEEHRFALALLRPHLTEMVGRRGPGAAGATLTQRQRELMRLVAEGHTNGEIAAALHVSPHTVRTHLANIFEKLGVSTRSAAVARVFST